MPRLFLSLLPLLVTSTTAPLSTFEVDVTGLRNTRGLVQVCLTRRKDHFPDCKADPDAVSQSVAATSHRLMFTGLAPGHYAVALFHDENSNRRMDKILGVPREGFGFSRNPPIRFGAPAFNAVVLDIPAGASRATIRMQYLF